MRTLNRDLKLMCQRNRDGSFATQKDRERMCVFRSNVTVDSGGS